MIAVLFPLIIVVTEGFHWRQAVTAEACLRRVVSVADASWPGLDGVGRDERDGPRRGGQRRREKGSIERPTASEVLREILLIVYTHHIVQSN
jgi:hypothetical protein